MTLGRAMTLARAIRSIAARRSIAPVNSTAARTPSVPASASSVRRSGPSPTTTKRASGRTAVSRAKERNRRSTRLRAMSRLTQQTVNSAGAVAVRSSNVSIPIGMTRLSCGPASWSPCCRSASET